MAIDLVLRIYKATDSFPREERYGLIDQMRRAAVSVPCNIAEGAGRQTRREFANFLHIAQGSLSELDTLIELACRLTYIDLSESAALNQDMERLDKMLSGLIRRQRTIEESDRKRRGVD